MDKTMAHIHVYRNKKGKSNWVLTKLNFKKQIIIYKSHIRTNITIRNTIRVQTIDRHFWPNIFDPSLITSSSNVFHFLHTLLIRLPPLERGPRLRELDEIGGFRNRGSAMPLSRGTSPPRHEMILTFQNMTSVFSD